MTELKNIEKRRSFSSNKVLLYGRINNLEFTEKHRVKTTN